MINLDGRLRWDMPSISMLAQGGYAQHQYVDSGGMCPTSVC